MTMVRHREKTKHHHTKGLLLVFLATSSSLEVRFRMERSRTQLSVCDLDYENYCPQRKKPGHWSNPSLLAQEPCTEPSSVSDTLRLTHRQVRRCPTRRLHSGYLGTDLPVDTTCAGSTFSTHVYAASRWRSYRYKQTSI